MAFIRKLDTAPQAISGQLDNLVHYTARITHCWGTSIIWIDANCHKSVQCCSYWSMSCWGRTTDPTHTTRIHPILLCSHYRLAWYLVSNWVPWPHEVCTTHKPYQSKTTGTMTLQNRATCYPSSKDGMSPIEEMFYIVLLTTTWGTFPGGSSVPICHKS